MVLRSDVSEIERNSHAAGLGSIIAMFRWDVELRMIIRAILLPAEMFVSELIPKQSRKLTNGGAPISQPNRNDVLQNSSNG